MRGVDLTPRARPTDDPHAGMPLLRHGPEAGAAPLGMVLLHGRGDRADGILSLVDALHEHGAPEMTVLAPQAAGNTWYPLRFLEPPERNEPFLGSALLAVGRAVDVLRQAGLPSGRIVVAGFSQGACLASEWVARAGGHWGGLAALSGGLIGDVIDPARYPRRLTGTHAFFGCSDVDTHIPEERVHASARTLEGLGASVETRIYPGMDHTVNLDEVSYLARHLAALADDAALGRPGS